MIKSHNHQQIYLALAQLYHGAVVDFAKEIGAHRNTIRNTLYIGNASPRLQEIKFKAEQFIANYKAREVTNATENLIQAIEDASRYVPAV